MEDRNIRGLKVILFDAGGREVKYEYAVELVGGKYNDSKICVVKNKTWTTQ